MIVPSRADRACDLQAEGRTRLHRSLAAAAIGGAVLLVALELPLCPIALVLGIPCPGCGLTRGTLALMHGDITAAVAWHPLAPVMFPAVLVGATRAAFPALLRGARTEKWLTWGAGLLFLCLTAVWLTRFLGAFGGPVAIEGPVWRLIP